MYLNYTSHINLTAGGRGKKIKIFVHYKTGDPYPHPPWLRCLFYQFIQSTDETHHFPWYHRYLYSVYVRERVLSRSRTCIIPDDNTYNNIIPNEQPPMLHHRLRRGKMHRRVLWLATAVGLMMLYASNRCRDASWV